MWKVEYYEKNGDGFCGDKDPFIEPDFYTFQEASTCADELRKSGYVNVKVLRDYSEEIYIVEVQCLIEQLSGILPEKKVSHEAYKEIDMARNFCKTRGDNPEKISDYTYRSDKYLYKIIPLQLK